jgi:hypothetical protein
VRADDLGAGFAAPVRHGRVLSASDVAIGYADARVWAALIGVFWVGPRW